MRPTLILRRTPLIKFLGKRSPPKQVDHTPAPHPASPTHSLPESFASYRDKATQHGPLKSGTSGSVPSSPPPGTSAPSMSSSGSSVPRPSVPAQSASVYGAIGGTSGHKLGSIKPKEGELFDRSELPKRFRGRAWTDEEMEATNSGGASAW